MKNLEKNVCFFLLEWSFFFVIIFDKWIKKFKIIFEMEVKIWDLRWYGEGNKMVIVMIFFLCF